MTIGENGIVIYSKEEVAVLYQKEREKQLGLTARDKIIMSKEIIRNLLCLLEDYKEQIVFDEDLQKIKKAEDFLNN